MQTNNVIDSSAASFAPAATVNRSGSRTVIAGACITLLCGAAIALSATGSPQVLAKLTVSGIEGNAIVEFDNPAHSAKQSHYRVDCSAISGGAASVWAEADFSPVVVAGLAVGEKYDCRASMTADADTLKAASVHVIGQD